MHIKVVKDTRIIFIRESMWQSIVSDTFTYGGLLAMIGVGVWLDSNALQWIAGLMWVLALGGRLRNESGRMTLEQAKKKIEEWEQEVIQ